MAQLKLKVLARTRDYAAIHKPAGVSTYSEGGEKSAKETLQAQFAKPVYPVHRLDKDTCGILLFAFNQKLAGEFARLFQTRKVSKQYLAIVHGRPPKEGLIDEPLRKNKSKEVEGARTKFQTLAGKTVEWEGESREYSLVCCEMLTGRYHQIRRHLRHIGHPICGDPRYGNRWNNEQFEKRFGIRRTLLSAFSIRFPDRLQNREVHLSTRPDEDFRKVLSYFNWKY